VSEGETERESAALCVLGAAALRAAVVVARIFLFLDSAA
jgi:hypothetical protein